MNLENYSLQLLKVFGSSDGWVTDILILIACILIYVARPLPLVLRDKGIWWCINRFILNDLLRARILMRAGDMFEIQKKYGSSASMQWSTAGCQYFLYGAEVSSEEFKRFNDNHNFHARRVDSQSIIIDRKDALLSSMLRHFKMGPSLNPISQWEKSASDQVLHRKKTR